MSIRFTVDLSEAHSGILKVRMEFPSSGKEEIVMPVWAPGSYLVMDFARHVTNIKSKGELRQISKNRWSLLSKGSTAVVNYEVYCDELTVETSYAGDSFVLINGTSVFFYPEGKKDSENSVKFVNYGKWKIITGLPEKSDSFVSEDYDHLVDSPFLIGNFELMEFSAMNKKHYIAWSGRMPKDRKVVTDDFRRIVEAELRIFGKPPYEKYVFMVIVQPDNFYGGLEHKNSTVIMSHEHKLIDDFDYKVFLTTVSHEFFHTWNVKRIRPRELGPFDYTKEVYTELLWLSEGFTSYYEWLILWRAGIINEEEYMNHISKMIDYYRLQPGHTVSADYSSFNAWVKLYKPDGNLVNSYVSYYLKGELIAFALNSEILGVTGGKKSLDDVFRGLFSEFTKTGKGIDKKDFIEQVKSVMGNSAEEIVSELTETETEIKFEHYLRDLGYKISRRPYDKSTGPKGFMGMLLNTEGGKVTVKSVLNGYPAYQAGVLPGDELVAVNGEKFTDKFTRLLTKEFWYLKVEDLKEARPGDKIDLYVFRRHNLLNFRFTAAEEPKEMVLTKSRDTKIKERMLKG